MKQERKEEKSKGGKEREKDSRRERWGWKSRRMIERNGKYTLAVANILICNCM